MAKRSGGSALRTLGLAEIHKELRRRQRAVGTLQRRRARLVGKLTALDDKIRTLGGDVSGGHVPRRGRVGAIPGRKRHRNDMSLAEALATVLKGRTMGVTEVAAAVVRSGYQTTAANFRTIVNQTLIKNKGVFKKVSRGQYTAA